MWPSRSIIFITKRAFAGTAFYGLTLLLKKFMIRKLAHVIFVDVERENLLFRMMSLELVLNSDQLGKLIGFKLRWSKRTNAAILLAHLKIGGAILANRLLGDDADDGALSFQATNSRNSLSFFQLFGLFTMRALIFLNLSLGHPEFFSDKLFVAHDLVNQLSIILLLDFSKIKLLDFRQIVIISLDVTPSRHWFKHQIWGDDS